MLRFQREMEMMTFYLLDLSIVDASFSVLRPSLKCAAAVSLSCHFVGTMTINESLSLGRRIATGTDRTPAQFQLTMCMRRMARTVLQATVSRDPQVSSSRADGE
jgi:Cyclin, C-terminal domain